MKLITTEDYLLGVDDSGIKEGDLILYKNSSIAKCLGFPTDGGGGLKIQIQSDIAKIKTDFESCKKIIAHLPLNDSPILQGVPLLPPLENEDVWSCGLEQKLNELPYEKHLDDGQYNDGQLAGFEFGTNWGYNKAKEKYSLSNIIDLYIEETGYGMDMWSKEENEVMTTVGKIIQSLSLPKMPVEFECKTVGGGEYLAGEVGGNEIWAEYPIYPKTTTNAQGQTVLVGTYKY